MYGIGKETLGDNFKEFILFNKKYLSRGIKQFPGIADSEVSVGERTVKALLNETIYVNLDLRPFPAFDGEDFKSTRI